MSARTVLPVIAVGWPVQTCQKFGPLVSQPDIVDTARHRRDAEGDAAAQAARQAGAGRPDQPASRAQTQRHPIPLPLATQSSIDVKEKRSGQGNFVKLSSTNKYDHMKGQVSKMPMSAKLSKSIKVYKNCPFTVKLTKDEIYKFHEQGYLLLPKITTSEEVAWIREIYDRLFEQRVGWDSGDFFDFAGIDDTGTTAILPQLISPSRYVSALRKTIFR